MGKRFSDNEFAKARDATRCSGSASIVIADIAIAASLAAPKLGSSSGAAPTAGTSGVRRVDWTIATGSGSTGAAKRKRA
jgi:hypothetical protein